MSDSNAIVVCPTCGASDWMAQQVSFEYQAAEGDLRVQPSLGGGLQPERWGWHDTAMVETYAWDCAACGTTYADADLWRWAMGIVDTPAEPTSYVQAEIQWHHARLDRIVTQTEEPG